MWFWAVISGLIYYALAFWFYISGLRQMSASEAGLYLNLIPIFGVGGAYIFLGDRLTPLQWMGAICILLAVLAISVLQKNGLVLQNKFSQTSLLIEAES
jgi:drug/metabolite transporter (DMT)-like permease